MVIHPQTALTSTGHYQAEFNGQPIKDQKQDGDKQKIFSQSFLLSCNGCTNLYSETTTSLYWWMLVLCKSYLIEIFTVLAILSNNYIHYLLDDKLTPSCYKQEPEKKPQPIASFPGSSGESLGTRLATAYKDLRRNHYNSTTCISNLQWK